MTMKHWVEKNNRIIAIFETKEDSDIFIESKTGLKKSNFSEIRDYFRTINEKGYEQYFGDIKIKL